MIHDLIAGFSTLGGLTGLGGLIAAFGAWRKSSAAVKELRPNHGSSAADSLARIEATQAAHGEIMRSFGHQLGELHDRIITIERRRE